MPAKPARKKTAAKKPAKKKAAVLPSSVSLTAGKRRRRDFDAEVRDIGQVDNLPPQTPEDDKPNKSPLQRREAMPSGVGYRKTQLEDILASNPASRNLEIYPVSSSSGGHGYYMVGDAALYDLFDEMMDRDPIISGCIELKVAYLLMRSHSLEVADLPEDAPEADENTALAVHEWVQRALVEHPRFNYLLWVLALGTCQHGSSTVETVYTTTPQPEGYFIPDWFYHCHPGQFRFNRRGDMFLAGDRYEKDNIPATPRKFIRSVNPALYDNPYGMSDLVRLRFLYYCRKKGWINYLRVVEKNGVPFIHINIPEGVQNSDQVRAALEEALSQMLEDDALITGAGEDVKVHDRASNVSDTFYNSLLDRIDSTVVRYILGAELASTVKDRGARSLGEVHERTVLTRVLPLARLVEAAVNQLIRWLVEWNFGPGTPCPYYKFDTEESTTTEEAMKILTTAKALGIRVAVDQARGWLGLRPAQPGEEVITIGDLGVDAKGAITVNKERGAVPTDSDEARQQADADPEVAEDYQATGKAAAAFAAFMQDPQRKAFKGMFTSDTATGQAFRELFAAQAKGRQAQLSNRLLRAGEAAAADTLPALHAVLQDLRKTVADINPDNTLDLYRTKAAVDSSLMREAIQETAGHVVTSCAMLSLYYTTLALQDVRAEKKAARAFAEDEDYLLLLPASFKAAAEWMAQRKVMTTGAVKSLAKVIWEEKGGELADIERGLRTDILALAGTATTDGTRKVQGMITSAVDKGLSAGDFLGQIDKAIGTDAKGTQDAYWNNVFRTEVGNAYKTQQQINESDPEFQGSLWGHEGYNPGDDRSRPTHARIDGKRFKKDSTASRTLGLPPFAFQCRCALFALMAPGGVAQYRESSDALSVAADVQKFSHSPDDQEGCLYCAEL